MQYHVQRRGARFLESGPRTFRNSLIFASCCALLIGACTPYPIYTTAQEDDSDYTGRSPASKDTGGTDDLSKSDAEFATTTGEIAPSTIDPRVFARVVESYLGIPYKKGGRDSDGIDCSNLASVLHQDYSGRRLTPSTRALFKLPHEVPRRQLEVGDLVFFSFGGRTPTHVGVYMGNDRFVHASESQGVIYSSLQTPYYRDAYRGARRVM